MAANILLLGGTGEAGELARELARRNVRATYSYAGRVHNPKAQPLPTIECGFGGAAGLAAWIESNRITHVVDATHPFAAKMSINAAAACAGADVPLIALTRPPWTAEPEDDWTYVPDIAGAVAALDGPRRRVFLAIGRMHLDAFACLPQHFYLLRLVDAPENPPPLPDCAVEVARGPFDQQGDTALIQRHGIDLIVSKNAGGGAARAKIDAARALGLPVLMIERPPAPERPEVHDVAAVFDWLDHTGTDLGV